MDSKPRLDRWYEGWDDLMIRFCLHPGPVTSVNDGDTHIISAPQLSQLYGVSLSECLVVRGPNGMNGREEYLTRLLHLYPSKQGAAYWHISDAERRQYPLRDD